MEGRNNKRYKKSTRIVLFYDQYVQNFNVTVKYQKIYTVEHNFFQTDYKK